MNNYSMHLPSYSIGENVYNKIPEICEPYGKKVVAIGGKKAMAAARDKIVKKCAGSELTILDFIWYGGEATYENVEELTKNESVQNADMIFAIGGGKATDTAKCLGIKINKPVFSFPTIASNCSACTSVSIMYYPDGRFKEPFFFQAPPVHAFIDTEILVHSPSRYMWAGMGDTYAKYFESTVSSRGEELNHYTQMGVTVSKMCFEPIIRYGKEAMEANNSGKVSYAYEQVVLAIIVSTGIASIFLTAEHIIDYNTGLAHAIFYSLTAYPHIEKNHLHGEVVSYGVLNLLLVDNDMETFEKVYGFSKSVGLPVCLEDLEFEPADIDKLAAGAVIMKDIEHNPYPITKEMLIKSMNTLEEMKVDEKN
jgi:glycerol dehydrogenase